VSDSTPRPPSTLARRFVRYVSGFGVGVALGMAPFLGVVEVPGFEALLRLFPRELAHSLIPLSAFLMGVVAVAVQFYSGERIAATTLRRRFKRTLILLLVGFLLLVVLYTLFVRTVAVEGGARELAFTTGWQRLPSCGCPPQLTDVECLKELSANPAATGSCWGRQLLVVRLSLTLAYLLVTGGFGALVGLLLLAEERRRRRRSR